MANPGCTVLVVDQSRDRAAFYRQLIQGVPELSLILTRAYEDDLLKLCQSHAVQLVLLVSHFPATQGFELLEQLCQLRTQCPPVIMIDRDQATLAVRAMKLGAADYLAREQISGDILAQAIRTALAVSPLPLILPPADDRYRTLLESIDEGFCICEMLLNEAGSPVDYRFLEANPIFGPLTGLEQVVGKTARDLIPDLEDFWFATYAKVALQREPIRFEQQSVPMQRWFDVYAFPMGEPHSRLFGVLFSNITARKIAEQERERFLAIGADLQVITGYDGYFHWVSPTFESVLGWTPAEMTARPWTDFVHPDDLPSSTQEADQLFEGNQTLAFENRYRHKDGSYRWLLWRSQPDLERQVLYGTAIDISDHRRVETALRERETELGLVTNAVPALISFIDADQRYRFTNRKYEEWFGRPAAETYGMHIREGLGEELYEAISPYVEQVLAGQQVSYETQILHKDGSCRYINATYVPRFNEQGCVEGFVALVNDISDRKQAEKALRESEAHFRHMADHAPFMVWVTDPTGYCTYLSQNWYNFSGQTEATGLGFGWLEVVHPEDREASEKTFLAANERQEAFQLEYRLRRKDGEYRWAIDAATPWFGLDGDFKGYVGSVIDIHDRKQTEVEREQLLHREQAAREAAERANRIKDEFLSILSHELRSPLNPILGWAKLLQVKKLDEARTAQALATIERNAKLQTQLIDDLLDMSRILRGKLSFDETIVNLKSVIEAALEVVRTAAEAKSISLQPNLADIGQVRGDNARLQQIVWNLLTNAIKFTPQGGQVTLRLEQVNNHALISVTDTGRGISPEFLPHIFESFRQEDASITRHHGGLGLGLSIVKYLVDAHGGTIVADSAGEGQGASFQVTLPLWASGLSGSPASLTMANLNLSGIKVLAVDDSLDTCDFVDTLLTELGAVVKSVASGDEALTLLSGFAPDVLICDISMPGMDGYTLIQQIRVLPPAQGGSIPAIAVTAYAREEDRQLALKSGFQKHISKPIELEKLAIAVAELAPKSLS